MKSIAGELRQRSCILSTGGASGSDQAFMSGAGSDVQLWLPEQGFEGYTTSNKILLEAYEMAERIHPYWDDLDEFGRNAHARNCHILLGADLETPVKFVIAYTENGAWKGGTATGLRIAKIWRIPTFNIGQPGAGMEDLVEFIDENA